MNTRRCNKDNGFTLIEIMIVVAIIGIIAAVAMPSYRESIVKSKRTVAKTHLMDIAARQEQYLANNKRYAASLTDLGLPATYYVDESGESTAGDAVYRMTLGGVATFAFTITATPQGSLASDDTRCGTYTYNETGAKTYSKGGDNSICW